MKDGFGREITYLRLSVTELCNLRCRYCMPAEGVCKRSHDEMLTQEETLQAVRVAAELGMRTVIEVKNQVYAERESAAE